MDEILAQLNRIRGIGGSMLVSADGLPMASALRQDIDESKLSAAAGHLIGTTQRLCQATGIGTPTSFNAAGEQGGLLLLAAGPAYLAVVVDPAANLALLTLEARPFVERLAQRLSL